MVVRSYLKSNLQGKVAYVELCAGGVGQLWVNKLTHLKLAQVSLCSVAVNMGSDGFC